MDWRGMCTLAVVMLVPAVIITFIIEKNLVTGLTFGALKGQFIIENAGRFVQRAEWAFFDCDSSEGAYR